MRGFVAAVLLAVALPAAAQSTPAANYSDMWYLPSEPGWGVSFMQHASHQVFAVWYTYDPRTPDPDVPGRFKPLWLVMPGGTWTSPTSITGAVFVTDGQPFTNLASATRVGSFSFSFSSASSGTFSYQIAPPAGVPASDPAFGLPSFSGAKAITRQGF